MYSTDFMTAIDREHSIEPLRILQAHVRGQDTLDAMLYIDTKTWLPDDLLIKADKMTMANSIELRVPCSITRFWNSQHRCLQASS